MPDILLTLPQNRSQDTGYWMAKHHNKKMYLDSCRWPFYQAFGPFPRPDEPAMFEKVRISAVMYVWNKNDPDAVAGRLKFPIDALVHYRIIPDDSEAHVELGEIRQEINRQKPRLILTVEEIE